MSSSDSVFQQSFYVGINLQDMLYGIELVLYFKTMRALLFHQGRRKKSDVFYAIFSTVMLLMTTIWVSTQAIFGAQMWLENTDFPGGPDAYWAENISAWYVDWGVTAITVLQLMTDALMIYRCRMVCDSLRIVLVPAILWLASLVLGILVIWRSSLPGGNFFQGTAAQLALSYYSVSVFLTAMLTGIIGYRMLVHGLRVKENLGKDYAAVYFAMLSLVVESVLPYTLAGIAFLVSFGMNSQISNVFACAYLLMMSIAPQMLILRVAAGRLWTEETTRARSTVEFATGDTSVCTALHGFDDSATIRSGKETV